MLTIDEVSLSTGASMSVATAAKYACYPTNMEHVISELRIGGGVLPKFQGCVVYSIILIVIS